MTQLTLDPLFDRPRLSTLRDYVDAELSRGEWLTLGEIRAQIGRGSEAGISARIRKLRGLGMGVEKRRRGDASRGLWEYRRAQ